MQAEALVGISLFNYQDDARSNKHKIDSTIFSPVVLYGCETWSLTLRETRKVFENRVLRRIFGPKRDDIAGDLTKH